MMSLMKYGGVIMLNLGKETETLEFKKTTGEIKEGMISIASILNKRGIMMDALNMKSVFTQAR